MKGIFRHMAEYINRQWRLAARPVGNFKDSDFTWHEEPVPDLADGQVLVRNIYLSLDPTNRIWAAQDSYLPAVPLGDVMRGVAVGVVEASRHAGFPVGTFVQGLLGWQLYYVGNGQGLTPIAKIPGHSLLLYHGVLGAIGLTAYFGLLDIGRPREGETLVVSAAAGAVGSMVGQIGNIKGCHVVGIAGGPEKCRWIVEDLGFDAAIDYKHEDVAAALTRYCPKGIDVYFDNVGGAILDAALARMNNFGRVVACGAISQYTSEKPPAGPANFLLVISKRLRIEGFIVLDYLPRAQEAIPQLLEWIAQGRLKYRLDVVDGLEQAPRAVQKLFDGSNIGKLVVKVSDEP
ncbi:Putative NADP-dependent oxidoreductase [Chloracidobacterium thermophilum B]|uniref:Putative NADP-dependent oxidoreductase n=2 Tax=Chloracidobacterium thermophilum TaxID=458033 RepID=G2LFL5_CHLTF|nr:Putative NADP-dependent oxidoreductase [Chloracidobacterium thermophilum B]